MKKEITKIDSLEFNPPPGTDPAKIAEAKRKGEMLAKFQEMHTEWKKAEALVQSFAWEVDESPASLQAKTNAETLKAELVKFNQEIKREFPDLSIENAGSWWNLPTAPPADKLMIRVNDRIAYLPTTLHGVTLGERIDFAFKYGNDLDAEYKRVREIKDPEEQAAAHAVWTLDKMYKELSFWSSVPEGDLRSSQLDEQMVDIYMKTLYGLIENE